MYTKFDVDYPMHNAVIIIADGDHIRRIPLGPLSATSRVLGVEDSGMPGLTEPAYVPPRRRTALLPVAICALFVATIYYFFHIPGLIGLVIALIVLGRRK